MSDQIFREAMVRQRANDYFVGKYGKAESQDGKNNEESGDDGAANK